MANNKLIAIIFLVVAVAIIVAPIVVTNRDSGEYVCTNTSLTLNETLNLCFVDDTNHSLGNETSTYDYTLSSTERTMLGIITVILSIGAVYITLGLAGVIKKKE